MKKNEIVKSNILFNEIIKNGKKCQNQYFIIYNKENEENLARFGITIGKKNGNAVIRNKQKRRFRMLITNNKKLFSNNQDYIIIIKKASIFASYDLLEKELNKIMK